MSYMTNAAFAQARLKGDSASAQVYLPFIYVTPKSKPILHQEFELCGFMHGVCLVISTAIPK